MNQEPPSERSGELRAFPDGSPIEHELGREKTSAEELAGAWGKLGKAGKIASSITAIVSLLAIPLAVALWIVSTVEDAKAEVKTEVKAKTVELREHTEKLVKDRPVHDKAVSKDLFVEHERRFEREAKRSESRDRELSKKLDVLGSELYRSERRWRSRLVSEGLDVEGADDGPELAAPPD